MITNNPPQLSKILSNLQIESLAYQTGFSIRQARKIDVDAFLLSFFQMVRSGRFCLRQWARNISAFNGSLVSFQAIAKKLDFRQEHFFHALFQKALLNQLEQKLNFQVNDILQSFARVLIEDSTCFKLPKALFDFFPGARLPHGRMAGARLQLRVNLKGHHYESIALRSYCQNDQTYAGEILNTLQKDDLIIRDLGYWSIPTFKKIHERGAYFLSRLNLGINVLCPVTQQNIGLAAYLRKQELNGIYQIDMPILVSKKYRMPLRLVAIKLSPENAQKRRRMARQQRHKDTPITEQANYLMSWNLFITNVSDETWDAPSVQMAYSLRWHIEMIFKCWKSKFNFTHFFKSCNGRNPVKPEIILLLIMTWIVLCFVPSFNFFANAVYKRYQRILSPIRFADFIIANALVFRQYPLKDILALLAYHSCYDKRKDRKNHLEKIYMNFLS